MEAHIHNIRQLLSANGFPEPERLLELPSSGSGRTYFRIHFRDASRPGLLASFNENINENIAQYSFTLHFLSKGFRVPKIFARDESYRYFLLEDLGSESLFQLVQKGINSTTLRIYKQVITDLIQFQIKGIQGLDLDVAWPVRAFSARAVLWDLNYFKYYFLKPHNIRFDENKLEDDFQRFASFLLEAETAYFHYRDFQSRNIMLKNGQPWYIDFQGGRQGPLQYDLVSLLYQARARLPEQIRAELLEHYLQQLEKMLPGAGETFLKHYDLYIFFRTMQVFGAYGFRGKFEGKAHFLESIPFALQNLRQLLDNKTFPSGLPELRNVLEQCAKLEQYQETPLPQDKLTVRITSFSYKKNSIPYDPSGNGGGFVFDCRALPNPYREISIRDFNGTQSPVIRFLENRVEVQQFLRRVFDLSRQSIDNYLHRKFNHLQISFGCTGGKHRSVYSAERLAGYLNEKYGKQIEIRLEHLQLQNVKEGDA